MLEVARRLLFKQSLNFAVADGDIAALRSRFATELRAQKLILSKPTPPPASKKGKEVMLPDHNPVFNMTAKEAATRGGKGRDAPQLEESESASGSDLNSLSLGFSEPIEKYDNPHLIEAAEFIKNKTLEQGLRIKPEHVGPILDALDQVGSPEHISQLQEVFMFLRRGHHIRRLYPEGELDTMQKMVYLVDDIRQGEAAAATQSLIDRFRKADFGMLWRAAVEEMWRKRGNSYKKAEIHKQVRQKICASYEVFHKGSKSTITPTKIDSWRNIADHWWEISMAFDDESLFYGFLMALPTDKSKPFVRATHDLLRLVPDVARTFFDKVIVFSKGLSEYARQISSTARIAENQPMLGLEIIDLKWIDERTPTARLLELGHYKPQKVYEHLAIYGKRRVEDGFEVLSKDMEFGGVGRLTADTNVELKRLQHRMQSDQAKTLKLEATRTRLQTLSPSPARSLGIDSLPPRIIPVPPKAERLNVGSITHCSIHANISRMISNSCYRKPVPAP
jgi:hypothetical protein